MKVRKRNRMGAATLETAIVLSLFLTLVLGLVDLGYGVFRQHVLTQAARQLARHTVVRGALADRLEIWGPDPISLKADESHSVTDYIAPQLVGWDLKEVDIDVQWPDGGNDFRDGDRVQVQMSAPYRPTMTFIFGSPSFDLSATSTMHVAH